MCHKMQAALGFYRNKRAWSDKIAENLPIILFVPQIAP